MGRSDLIAGLALVVAAGSLGLQFYDRGQPFDVQSYVDRGEASNKIIDSLEQLINARQLAMISVKYNIYEPVWAQKMTLQEMNADAAKAAPVVTAFGNFGAALQNNQRYFNEADTSAALSDLADKAGQAVKCFTDLASANHELSTAQVAKFRDTISTSCNGANQPPSLDALKEAEANAMNAMEAERKKRS